MRICPQCRITTIERVCPEDGYNTVLAVGHINQVDPLIGATFAERYEIKSLVGKGGFGSVYRAAPAAGSTLASALGC